MARDERVTGKPGAEKEFVKAHEKIHWYDGLQSFALAQLRVNGFKFGP